jgi:hypothetical protein
LAILQRALSRDVLGMEKAGILLYNRNRSSNAVLAIACKALFASLLAFLDMDFLFPLVTVCGVPDVTNKTAVSAKSGGGAQSVNSLIYIGHQTLFDNFPSNPLFCDFLSTEHFPTIQPIQPCLLEWERKKRRPRTRLPARHCSHALPRARTRQQHPQQQTPTLHKQLPIPMAPNLHPRPILLPTIIALHPLE